MPNYQKRDFQLGEFYLSKRGNSPAWCRTWFDSDTRQTRRISLGTADFEQAKQALTDWFVLNQTRQNQPAGGMPIAEIIARYWEHHGQGLNSAYTTRLSLNYWLDFYGDESVDKLTSVERQEAFHRWLLAKGMKSTTASRVLTAGRAAINRAWKRGEISSAPFIHPMPNARQAQQSAEPKGRALDVEEVARLLSASDVEHFRAFVLIMLATTGRPDAIRELTLAQCDIDNRLIALNPPGRTQTTKYRPTVRMPESIVPLITFLGKTQGRRYLVGEGDEVVKSLRSAWRGARRRAGLDDRVNPYSLRHTMARWLRKEGVPAWEVSAQLGHKRPDLSITEIYAPHDPTYLDNAVRAIDSFFAELRANCVLVEERIER